MKFLGLAFEEEDAKRTSWEHGRCLSHAPITEVGKRFRDAVRFMQHGLIPWLSGRKEGIDFDALEEQEAYEWEQSMWEYVCSRCDAAMAIRCLKDETRFDCDWLGS